MNHYIVDKIILTKFIFHGTIHPIAMVNACCLPKGEPARDNLKIEYIAKTLSMRIFD
jgi:hypothetical protein